MSAPGAGQGVSWVDVAASAAGIYRQMETIGKEAAAGFVGSFSSTVGSSGHALVASTSHFGTAAGTNMARNMEAAFGSFVGKFIPEGKEFVELWARSGKDAGAQMSKNFMTELQQGISALGPPASLTAAGGAFASAGVRSGEMFTKEFTNKVASGLSALGGIDTNTMTAALGAAGLKGGEKYAAGLAQGLSTLGGASLAQAVDNVMNGLAVHAGDVFAKGLSSKVSAGLQVLSGANIADDLVKSLSVAGEVGGGLFSKSFIERYEIGLKSLGVSVAPSLEQFKQALASTGVELGSTAAGTISTYFQAQFKAMAERAIPQAAAIKSVFKDMGVTGTDTQMAAMATSVEKSLRAMAGTATDAAKVTEKVMKDAAAAGGAAWNVDAADAVQGWAAKMVNATKVSGQNIQAAARQTGGDAGRDLLEGFAAALQSGGAAKLAGTEVMDRAFAQMGASEAGVRAANAMAGGMLDHLGEHLTSGFHGLMGKLGGLATRLGGEAGMGAGLAIAGGIGLAVTVGGEMVLSSVKNLMGLVNKEVTAFGKVGAEAAEALMGGFAAVTEAKIPDVQAMFGVIEEAAKTSIELPLNTMTTAIDSTVGHIPLIGEAFKLAGEMAEQSIGAVFGVIDVYKGVATEFGNIILEIGEKWKEAGRSIVGQTLGIDNLHVYLETVRDIAASGDLVHFQDISTTVGELYQRFVNWSDAVGLSRDELTELATVLAEGNEVLGNIHINVDNLTSAFSAFSIGPEHAAEELENLINLSRQTGAGINDLLRDLDTTSPAWLALGFNMKEAEYIMARVNEQLGRPAMDRFSFSLARLPAQLEKSGTSLKEFNEDIKAFLRLGEDSEDPEVKHQALMRAVSYVMTQGIPAKAAENMVDMIAHGIPFAVEDAAKAVEENSIKMKDAFGGALEVTKTFKDELETLSNQLGAALMPLGEGLVEALNGIGDKVTHWLQTHQVQFLGFVGAIGEGLLDWGAKITHFLATALRDMSGFVEGFKDFTVVALEFMAEAVFKATDGFELIPDSIASGFTKAMKSLHKAAGDSLGPLEALHDLDIGAVMNTAATGVDALGNSLEGVEGPLADLIRHSQDAATLWQSFRADYGKVEHGEHGEAEFDKDGNIKRKAAKLQDALGGSLHGGMTIDASALDEVTEALEKQGIKMQATVDSKTGLATITDFTAHSEKEMQELQKYLNTRFGAEDFAKLGAKIHFKVELPPDKTLQQFLIDDIGVPSELAKDDGIHAKFFLDDTDLPPELKKFFDAMPGTPNGPSTTAADRPAPAGSGQMGQPNGPGWFDALSNGPAVFGGYFGANLRRLLGFGGYAAGGSVVGGKGGVDDVPALLTEGEKVMTVDANRRFGPALDAMNSGAVQHFATGGNVLAAAGIPDVMRANLTGQGITLPAGIAVVTPQPMTDADTLTRAGVPDKYQGDVTESAASMTGVALPTGLDVKDADRKDVGDVMTAVGVPSDLQGSDGVKVPVKLELLAGDTLSDTGDTSLGASGDTSSPPGPGPGGAVQDQVHQAMRTGGFAGVQGLREGGFPESEWSPLSSLIQGESSWNPGAKNPSSGAFGLFQFLGHENDEYGRLGAYSTNPYQQATAGMAYIKARYGTPTNAYNTWLGRSPHWYHTGGPTEGGPAELEADEHVLTRDDVTAAGGHGAIRDFRKRLHGYREGGSAGSDFLGGLWDEAKNTVKGLAHAALHLPSTIESLSPLMPTSLIPGAPTHETATQFKEAWKGLGKELTHWDEWSQNPWRASGETAFDVAALALGPLAKVGKLGKAGEAAGGAAKVAEAPKWTELPEGQGFTHPSGGVIKPSTKVGDAWQLYAPTVARFGNKGSLAPLKQPTAELQPLMEFWNYTQGGPKPGLGGENLTDLMVPRMPEVPEVPKALNPLPTPLKLPFGIDETLQRMWSDPGTFGLFKQYLREGADLAQRGMYAQPDVATMVQMVREADRYHFDAVDRLSGEIIGGGPVPKDLADKLRLIGGEYAAGIGASEPSSSPVWRGFPMAPEAAGALKVGESVHWPLSSVGPRQRLGEAFAGLEGRGGLLRSWTTSGELQAVVDQIRGGHIPVVWEIDGARMVDWDAEGLTSGEFQIDEINTNAYPGGSIWPNTTDYTATPKLPTDPGAGWYVKAHHVKPHYVAGGMLHLQPGGLLDPGQNPLAPGTPGYSMTENAAIIAACRAEGVDPATWLGPMKTLIGRESGGQTWGRWNPNVTQHGYTDVNTGGNEAVGAAQVTPGTAAQEGIDPKSLRDPISNIRASIRHIKSTYAGTGAPRLGRGGLGKLVDQANAIFNVQQAEAMMPSMGYAEGGSILDGMSAKGASLLGGLLTGILGELGITLPTGGGTSGPGGPLWDMLDADTTAMQTGGHVQGDWLPGRDSVPMGLQPGTFVVNRNSSAQYRSVLDQLMSGPGGTAGGHGRTVPTILEVGERLVPPHIAMPNAGLLHAINSGNLEQRQDGGQSGVLQVIYNPPNTHEYYGEAAPYGKVGPGTSQPQYYGADWGGHHGHVHTSFDTGPNGEPFGLPLGTNLPATGKESPGFPSWVYQLGRRYGMYASTYPDHQVHGGKIHGLDWWPVGKADMSGLSYTPEETDRMRRFAGAMTSMGASGGSAWASGYAGSASAAVASGGRASSATVRSRLKAILPPWLSRALGLQEGGPVIVPSPSGMLGGDGPQDGSAQQKNPDDVYLDGKWYPRDAVEPKPDNTGWQLKGHGIVLPQLPIEIPHAGTKKTDPNLPQVPSPVGPGQPNVPPPKWWPQPVPVDTPGAIDISGYGPFLYTMDMPDKGQSMTQEQRKTYNEWVRKAEKAQKKTTDDQVDLGTATQDQLASTIRMKTANDNYAAILADLTKGLSPERAASVTKSNLDDRSTHLAEAKKEQEDATTELTRTTKALNAEQQRLHDSTRDEAIAEDNLPPWQSKATSTSGTPDAHASELGAGLVAGIGQELGFGDLFKKAPWEWGIWKLFAGGASYGLNLLNSLGDTVGGAEGSTLGTGYGPSPGGSSTAPPVPGGDQHMPAPASAATASSAPDAQGVYTLPDGTKDVPVDGGYLKPHPVGDEAWDYDADSKRFYPPGKKPKKAAVAESGDHSGGGEGGDGHGAAESAVDAENRQEGITYFFDQNGKKHKLKHGVEVPLGEGDKGAHDGGEHPPAEHPTGGDLHSILPPTQSAPAPVQGDTLGPALRGSGDVFLPPGLIPHGPTPQASSGNPSLMDRLLHPAGIALASALKRGDIAGPPPPSTVTSGMAPSEGPARVPVAAQVSGGGNTVNYYNNQSGMLQTKDEAADFFTSAAAARSGFTTSMIPPSIQT